ncbi:pitrilysin family protein [Amycolatopsis sp. NPDC051102]|uniref:M16 family metallopeptidase n=1 Tax=Amycolatopsis sp. NPDC051102 TaxID=3155163 RepID=UPI00342A083E
MSSNPSEDTTGAFVARHRPWLRTTTLCVALARGSRDDRPGRAGAAHLFEHLVMSARGSGSALTDLVEERGGTANASSGNELTLYYARVADEDAPQVAAALWRAVESPQITEADLIREKNVVAQEIATARADAGDVVQDAFLADLFGSSHPLGRPVAGDPGDVASFTPADAEAERERGLPPHRVVVVGGADPGRIRAALPEHALLARDFRRPGSPPEPVRPGPAAEPAAEGEFAWVAVGGRAVPARDPACAAYAVLGHLLGSSPASSLYRELRDAAGLAYTFQAWPSHYTDAGAWRVLMGVESGNVPKAVAVVERLLHRIAETGPSAREHAIAVRQAVGQSRRDAEDPWQLTIDLALRGGLDPSWTPESEQAALQQVTPGQVRAAAARVAETLKVTVRT